MGLIPGSGRPLEKGMATQTSFLAWRIPQTEESGTLWTMGLQRVRQDGARNTHRAVEERKTKIRRDYYKAQKNI